MKPLFSREAVVDRRQPQVRWSAVVTGALLALGLWNLLGLLFVGGALTAVDPDELDRFGVFGIGTGVGSVLAPLLAMFAGGLAAGRLAAHYDRRVAAAHGALVWAIASIAGVVILAIAFGGFVDRRAATMHDDDAVPARGTTAYVEEQVRSVNQHLRSQGAPAIDLEDFLDAARYAASDGRTVDRDAFVSRLDARTDLSRPEAEAALAKLGDDAPEVIVAGREVALHRQQVMAAAEATGNAMLGAGVTLVFCLAAAIAGALLGAGVLARGRRGDRDTLPGHPVPEPAAPAPESPEPLV